MSTYNILLLNTLSVQYFVFILQYYLNVSNRSYNSLIFMEFLHCKPLKYNKNIDNYNMNMLFQSCS